MVEVVVRWPVALSHYSHVCAQPWGGHSREVRALNARARVRCRGINVGGFVERCTVYVVYERGGAIIHKGLFLFPW